MVATLLEIAVIAVVPVSLILFGVVSVHYRFIILSGVVLVVSGLVYLQGISLDQLGVSTDFTPQESIIYALLTTILFVGLLILAKLTRSTPVHQWYRHSHFLGLFILISAAQQFVFQGFILLKLSMQFPTALAVVLTGLLFGYLHMIYPRPFMSFVVTSGAGILFAAVYTYYPNLLLIASAHAVLNFTAVYLGLFSFSDNVQSSHPRVT